MWTARSQDDPLRPLKAIELLQFLWRFARQEAMEGGVAHEGALPGPPLGTAGPGAVPAPQSRGVVDGGPDDRPGTRNSICPAQDRTTQNYVWHPRQVEAESQTGFGESPITQEAGPHQQQASPDDHDAQAR